MSFIEGIKEGFYYVLFWRKGEIMDAFSKIRKSAGREEQKRQMINKAIDLLHKLSNKRLDFDDAKSEISRVISEYYVLDESAGVADNTKINLEVMINNSFDVINGVKDDKLNLYQAIMLMNKVMAHGESSKEESSKKIEKPAFVEEKKQKVSEIKKEVKLIENKVPDIKEVKSAKGTEVTRAMNDVIENKKKYLQSIEQLNEILKAHGFSLSALEPK